MPRLRNSQSGVVVSVSDETAARLGREWEPAASEGATPAAKPAPRKRTAAKPAEATEE